MSVNLSRTGIVFEIGFKVGILTAIGYNINEFWDSLEDFDGVEELSGISSTVDRNDYTGLVYHLGVSSGEYYARDKKIKFEDLRKYRVGEETVDVTWRNADLLYVKDNVLYVVDFKLAGAVNQIKKIFENKEEYLPVINYGVPVNMSVGRVDFFSFAKSVIEQKENLEKLPHVYAETRGLAQLLCYAVDYLYENPNKEEIKRVSIELLYPIAESMRIVFPIVDISKEELGLLKTALKEIYKNLKSEREQTEKRDLKQEWLKREETEYVIPVDSIDEARRDVDNKITSFFNKSDRAKAICLLHSAGSGKTSTTINKIINSKEPYIAIYMTTRRTLLERVKNLIIEKGLPFADPYDSKKKRYHSEIEDKGQGYDPVSSDNKGKVKTMVDTLCSFTNQNKEQIWGIVTIQALTTVSEYNKETYKHLMSLINANKVTKYRFHIILDEFFGYSNGFYAINCICDFINEVKKRPGYKGVNLYLFDANGYSPPLIEYLLQQYDEHNELLPDSVTLCDFKPSVYFEHKGIPFEAHALHGYPSEGLTLHRKLIASESIETSIASYINETFGSKKETSTAFVFCQNKDMINALNSELWSKYSLKSLVATASSMKTQGMIEEMAGKGKNIILGTSSVSRGIDFKVKGKPVDYIYVVITDWGIEQNLVEIIQAISRTRGDEETEKRHKHLHLLYIIQKDQDYIIDSIGNYTDTRDMDIIKNEWYIAQMEQKLSLDDVVFNIIKQFLKTPEYGEKIAVPVPAQYRPIYNDNLINYHENIMTFLSDIYSMGIIEKSKEKALEEFINIISDIITIYAEIKPSETLYHHPYIIIKNSEIHVNIDNSKRERAKNLFKSLKDELDKHNSSRTTEIDKFIDMRMIKSTTLRTTFLLPIYSVVFTRHVLNEGEELYFRIGKRAGRSGVTLLGGSSGIRTKCKGGKDIKCYATLLLNDSYYNLPVLDGSFPKFPVEFIKNITRKKEGNENDEPDCIREQNCRSF